MGKHNPHRTRLRQPRLQRRLRAEAARLERAVLEAAGLSLAARKHLAAAQKSVERAIAVMSQEKSVTRRNDERAGG